jgi:hypothetical protein
MRHRSGTAPLQRRAGLGAAENLNLALLVNREHDGMRRRIDIKPDDIAQLGGELRVGRQLELTHPMRLQPVVRQMRCTEETLIPAASAIMLAVQWVVSPGGSS